MATNNCGVLSRAQLDVIGMSLETTEERVKERINDLNTIYKTPDVLRTIDPDNIEKHLEATKHVIEYNKAILAIINIAKDNVANCMRG